MLGLFCLSVFVDSISQNLPDMQETCGAAGSVRPLLGALVTVWDLYRDIAFFWIIWVLYYIAYFSYVTLDYHTGLDSL